MMLVAGFSSLIVTEDAFLPLQRDKPKSTIIKYVPIIFSSTQPTTKVADNQIEKYRYLLTLTE
jgi:hypothetical protein